jgi:hypothetical protein
MELIKSIDTKRNSFVRILLLEPRFGLGLSVEFGCVTWLSIELLAGIFKFQYTLTRVKHKKGNNNG